MEILLGFIIGASIGTAAHFVLPGRDSRGAAVLPILGALGAGLAWMILTWAGFAVDNPLLWLLAFVVPALVVFPTGSMLTRLRREHDARERARLKIS